MNTKRKRLVSLVLLFVVILFLALGYFALGMSFYKTDGEIRKEFRDLGVSININEVDFYTGKIRYLSTGNLKSKQAIIWIHGAPGGMDMFANPIANPQLQKRFAQYSIDRPGYGGSLKGQAFPELEQQAQAVLNVIQKIPQDSILLFAHSFGAPIAVRVAHESSKVKTIFLAGGALDPELEKFESLARLTNSSFFSSIASDDNKVASKEKLAHRKQLEELKPIYAQLNCKVIAIHGTEDWMVPYGNVNFLKRQVGAMNFIDHTLDGESHFFFTKGELLAGIINKYSS